jgi:hypothetical protein
MPRDTLRVFVSSTAEDLAEHRQAVRDAAQGLDFLPIMHEYWAAGGNPPLESCMERVDEADVLVVIVAHRYGWVPPGQDKSITWLEVQRARERDVPVLPFLLAENADWPAARYEHHRIQQAAGDPGFAALLAEVGRNVQGLKAFKAELEASEVRATFTSSEDLRGKVLHALVAWRDRHGESSGDLTERSRYLDWLRRECETVELLGLDLKDAQNVRLGQVYVLAVTPARAEKKDEDRPFERERHDLLLHLLGEASLYVPGAPGAGKSTFCRWLALVTASGSVPRHPIPPTEDYMEILPEDLQGRFPILCPLRQWSGEPECLTGNGRWTRKRLEDALACWLDATTRGGSPGPPSAASWPPAACC